MSEVGQCWDSAPVESFFGSLKREPAPDDDFAARDQARAGIFESFREDANRTRDTDAGANLGLVRRVAASLLKQDTAKGSIKAQMR